MDEKNLAPRLTTSFCGVTMPNPFVLASAPPTAAGDMIRRAFRLGWGGAVVKTIKPDNMEIADASPRFAVLKSKTGEIMGFENFELLSKIPLAAWLEEIAAIKREFPRHLLIGSIMASIRKEEWQDLARSVAAAGADAIELNVSCPHGMPEIGGGAAIGQVPEMTRAVTAWVKEAVSIPVMVKLTPNVTNICISARAARDGGADALSAINTVQCLMGVDLDAMRPLPDVDGNSAYGGYSGQAVRPVGLRCVAQIARETGLPLMGVGGIAAWRHAAEYMLLGAGQVQICTEVMLRGYGIIEELCAGLTQYLAQKGLQSPSQLTGLALPHLGAHAALNKKQQLVAVVDRARCEGCGLCVTACRDGGCGALEIDESRRLQVDARRCEGCSLCTHVCRRRAIQLRPR